MVVCGRAMDVIQGNMFVSLVCVDCFFFFQLREREAGV